MASAICGGTCARRRGPRRVRGLQRRGASPRRRRLLQRDAEEHGRCPGPTATRRCSRRSTTTPPPSSAWCATTWPSTPRCRPTFSIRSTRRGCRRRRTPSNNHYATAETNGVDLSATLKQTTQSGDLRHADRRDRRPASPRYGAEAAFFINGTNRAMFRFTMINHLCNDMPTLDGHHAADGSHPPGRGALARAATAACS